MFDIFCVGKNPVTDVLPSVKQINHESEVKSLTKMYWVIEPNVKITDINVFDFRPSDYDDNYEHVWKWNSNNYGGVKLVPRKQSQGIKEHDVVVCEKSFDVLFTTSDPQDYFNNHPYATHVWCADPDYQIPDTITWAPDNFEPDYIHCFHVSGQLEHKYPDTEGGIKLYPREYKNSDIKYHGYLDVGISNLKYPVIKTSDPENFSLRDSYDSEFVWIAHDDYNIDASVMEFIPSVFDRHRIHNFHLKHQLEHLYPDNMGGVYLVPQAWQDAEVKVMGELDGIRYPVLYVADPDNFSNRDSLDSDYVWLIDHKYKINPDTLNWVPSVFEDDQIHNFRMPNQLTDKYPQDMGGIYLVPQKWQSADTKIHKSCAIEDEIYDVYRVNHTELTQEKFTELANIATTPWFWVIDSDYDFNGKLRYVPAEHEELYIQVFKWGMEHRYVPEVTELWDNRVAGIYLVNKDFTWDHKKLHTDKTPIEYDVFYTTDVNSEKEYQKYARQSRTHAFWLVDSEHRLPDRINWVPDISDQKYINIFKLPGQLEHKYPRSITNVSDNRCGGVKLIPRNYDVTDQKFQGGLHKIEYQEFQKFNSVDQGIAESKAPWFWVIDTDTDVDPDFDWDFVPDSWDEGKTHVWQVANPVSGLSYDYGGIKLCHREPKGGRDKYIKSIGSTRKPLDVLYLDASKDIVSQLNNYESSTYMYYIVDPHVKLNPQFDFGIYPTQWDSDCVHLFKNSDGSFKNVRLVPAGYEFESLDQITNNSYDKLKEHDIVASINREWPVYQLTDTDAREFHDIRKSVTEPWFFTVDPDCDNINDVWDCEPDVNDFDRIHAWQRINPYTEQVHGYGGVRLWPTAHCDHITTDALKYNRIPRLRYVREPRSVLKPYPVILLSYQEERAQTAFDALSERNILGGAMWVKDVKGIFNAHKEAARLAGDHKMFWVVDADAELMPEFNFNYMPDVYDQDTVHVWTTQNPVTGSKYGYGGVKLFNTSQVNNSTSWGLDFTTGLSNRFKIMPEVCAITRFNTTAYDAWRSAFREVVKLTISQDPDAKVRIQEWMNPLADAEFGTEAKRGAEQAQAFAKQNINNISELDKINDYDWLQKKFKQG